MRSIGLLFLVLVAALAPSIAVFAQGPPADLFTTPPTRAARGKNGLAANRGRVNTDPLNYGAANIRIQLPDGDVVVFRQDKFEQRGDQDTAWRGVLQGRDDAQALLTLKGGMVAGLLRIGHDLYEIRPGADGQHIIEQLDEASFPACAGTQASPDESRQNEAPAETATANQEAVAAAAVTIDVMVVYTTAAKNAAGGASQLQATIQAAVDSANTTFSNSQVNASYRLVGTAEVAYTETGNLQTDLGWLRADANVANLRTTYGADLVSLFVENGGGYCGMGYMYSGSANSAHQVTARSCAVGNLTYAHEHGHNLGMNHDPANSSSSGYAADSYGHFVAGVFRTVMSYNNSGSCTTCPRVAYFSNPNVNYSGYATGIAGQRNNAATGNATAAIVAAYLAAASSSAPAAPSFLTAAPVSGTQVNLTWVDNSSNETGFLIERSVSGGSYTQIASVGANLVSYSNTGLVPLTTYSYRVRAAGTTNSAYSTAATATTPGAPPNAPSNLTAIAASTSQVNLLWTDNATNESGFLIERSTDGVNFTQIATTPVNIVNYSNTGLTAGTTYYYRVRANNGAGNSGYSNTAQATVPQALAAPWTSVDLNAPGLTGSASQANGSYTISGAGTLSGKADRFRFTYQVLSGDGEIKARINTLQNTGTSARVGVMIRDALTGGSRHAFMGVDGAGAYYWVRRSSTNGGSSSTSKLGSGAAPNIWVRLVRTGDTVYGYKSADGVNWTLTTSASITMGANIYIGFAVASGSTTVLNTSVFNTVTVVP